MGNNIMEANGKEIHCIEFLAGLDKQLHDGQDVLKERLKLIPNGWRDFRMAVSTIERLLDRIYGTLPQDTMVHMNRICSYGQVIIRPRPLVKLNDDVQIVGAAELRMLINTCVGNECGICVKDHAQQKGCKLRKALKNIAPTGAVHRDGRCSYLDVVAGNELGKYI